MNVRDFKLIRSVRTIYSPADDSLLSLSNGKLPLDCCLCAFVTYRAAVAA